MDKIFGFLILADIIFTIAMILYHEKQISALGATIIAIIIVGVGFALYYLIRLCWDDILSFLLKFAMVIVLVLVGLLLALLSIFSSSDSSKASRKVEDITEDAAKKRHHQDERNKITPGIRHDVLRRDHSRCRMCGRTVADGVKLEVDHIVPVSKGGKSEMSNLQTLCRDCNRGKGVK